MQTIPPNVWHISDILKHNTIFGIFDNKNEKWQSYLKNCLTNGKSEKLNVNAAVNPKAGYHWWHRKKWIMIISLLKSRSLDNEIQEFYFL